MSGSHRKPTTHHSTQRTRDTKQRSHSRSWIQALMGLCSLSTSPKQSSPQKSSVKVSHNTLKEQKIDSIVALFKEGYEISRGVKDKAFLRHRANIKKYIVRLSKAGCEWHTIRSCFTLLLKQGAYFGKNRSLLNPRVFDELKAVVEKLKPDVIIDGCPAAERFLHLIIALTKISSVSKYQDARKLLSVCIKMAEQPEKFEVAKSILEVLSSLPSSKNPRCDTQYIAQLLAWDQQALQLVVQQLKMLKEKQCLHFWREFYAPILEKERALDQRAWKVGYEKVGFIRERIDLFSDILGIFSKQKSGHLLVTDADYTHILKLEIEYLEALRSSIYRLNVAACLKQWKYACYALIPGDKKEHLKNPKDTQVLLDFLWASDGLNLNTKGDQASLTLSWLSVCYKLPCWRGNAFLVSPLFSAFINHLKTQYYIAQPGHNSRYRKLTGEQLAEEKTILEVMHRIVAHLHLDQNEQTTLVQAFFEIPLGASKLIALERLLKCISRVDARAFLANLMSPKRKAMTLDQASDVLTVLSEAGLLREASGLFTDQYRWQALFAFDEDTVNPLRVKRLIEALRDKELLTAENIGRVIELISGCKKASQVDLGEHVKKGSLQYALTPRLSILIDHVESLASASSKKDVFEKLIKRVKRLPLNPVFSCSSVAKSTRGSQISESAIGSELKEFLSKESVFVQSCDKHCKADQHSEIFHLLQHSIGVKLSETYAKKTRENIEILSKAGMSLSWSVILLDGHGHLIDPEQIYPLLKKLYRVGISQQLQGELLALLRVLPCTQANASKIVGSPLLRHLVGNIENISCHSTQDLERQMRYMRRLATIMYEQDLSLEQGEMLLALKQPDKFYALWNSIKENVGAYKGCCEWVLAQCHSSLDENHDLYAICKMFKQHGIFDKRNFHRFMRAMDRYTVGSNVPGHYGFRRERMLFVKCLFELEKIALKIGSAEYIFTAFFKFVSNDIAEDHPKRLAVLLTKLSQVSTHRGVGVENLPFLLKLLSDLQYRRCNTPLPDDIDTMSESMETSAVLDKEYIQSFEALLKLDRAQLAEVSSQLSVEDQLKSIMRLTKDPVCAAPSVSQDRVPSSACYFQLNGVHPRERNRVESGNSYVLPKARYQGPL